MFIYRIFIFFVFIPACCFPFSDLSPGGARAFAMGNAGGCIKDVWSANNNQAGLAFIKKTSAGIYYENRFLVRELSTKAACIVIPVKKSTMAVSVSSFGYSFFSKNKYGLAFAKMLGENFSVGIQADYFSTRLGEDYGKSNKLSAEIGFLYKPVKNLDLGFHIFNPNRTRLSHYNDERINTNLKLSAAYTFSDKLVLVAETEKEVLGNIEFKTGLEYIPVKEFSVRVGMHTEPSVFSFGFGLNLNKLKVDMASTLRPQLGVTNHVGISYEFGN